MTDEEINKLKTRCRLAEDNNRILAQKLKEKKKDLEVLNKLYQQEKDKTAMLLRKIEKSEQTNLFDTKE